MFYYLPNGRPIDIEGALDGMLDISVQTRYFLDAETGDIGCVETGVKSAEKLREIKRAANRYLELPRISKDILETWFENFVRDTLISEDLVLARQVRAVYRAHGFRPALKLLRSLDEYWEAGWDLYVGDRAFEDLGAWLRHHVSGVTYELKGCGECEICRACEGGAGLDELLDAFERQRHLNEDESA